MTIRYLTMLKMTCHKIPPNFHPSVTVLISTTCGQHLPQIHETCCNENKRVKCNLERLLKRILNNMFKIKKMSAVPKSHTIAGSSGVRQERAKEKVRRTERMCTPSIRIEKELSTSKFHPFRQCVLNLYDRQVTLVARNTNGWKGILKNG